MPVYIEKNNGDANQPTNRQGEYRAFCLFEIKTIKKRQRFAKTKKSYRVLTRQDNKVNPIIPIQE